MRYILASASPRRKELMKEISEDFLIDVSHADESHKEKDDPLKYVKHVAFIKGDEVYRRHPQDLVISADTIVTIDNKIIGKPVDEMDAKNILRALSNKKHLVLTAFCIFYQNNCYEEVVETEVYFKKLDEDLIDRYVASKSPLDKAGAYGIQDNDTYPIIEKIKGSLNNVIGFPVEEIKLKLKEIEVN